MFFVLSSTVTLVELATGVFPYPKEQNVYAMLRHIVHGESPGACRYNLGETTVLFTLYPPPPPAARLSRTDLPSDFIDFAGLWCGAGSQGPPHIRT